MNQIHLTGRLARDPELRTLENGSSVCQIRLAVEGMSPGNTTGYVNVAEFGPPGEASARRLTKGWLVSVAGRLQHETWASKEGQRREGYKVIGHVEHLAGPRGQDRERQQATEQSTEKAAQTAQGEPASGGKQNEGQGVSDREARNGQRAERQPATVAAAFPEPAAEAQRHAPEPAKTAAKTKSAARAVEQAGREGR